jgi:chorismate dehydratase
LKLSDFPPASDKVLNMQSALHDRTGGPLGQPLRVGSVSFLNAKPLIHGLEINHAISLVLDVPSRLLGGLQSHRLDVALLPVIDYQRLAGLRMLTAGGIASDGPTLTVRIFSREPISKITTLACDTDSHTSVALARILLAELYGLKPLFIDLDRDGTSNCPARLLIGDKVVCAEPQNMPHQLDLGEAWKRLTGLPFAFALWMARSDVDLGDLPRQLNSARCAGMDHIEQIVQAHALPRGWPLDTARRYLTEHLQFEIGPRHIEAIRLFHQLAHRHGVIEHEPWELRF